MRRQGLFLIGLPLMVAAALAVGPAWGETATPPLVVVTGVGQAAAEGRAGLKAGAPLSVAILAGAPSLRAQWPQTAPRAEKIPAREMQVEAVRENVSVRAAR